MYVCNYVCDYVCMYVYIYVPCIVLLSRVQLDTYVHTYIVILVDVSICIK